VIKQNRKRRKLELCRVEVIAEPYVRPLLVALVFALVAIAVAGGQGEVSVGLERHRQVMSRRIE